MTLREAIARLDEFADDDTIYAESTSPTARAVVAAEPGDGSVPPAAAGLTLTFWDGPGNQNDGTIQGGTGLWQNSTGNDNWTDAAGSVNAPWAASIRARNAMRPSSGAIDTSGTRKYVAPAMKSEAVSTPTSPMRRVALGIPMRTRNAATA